jgi:glycosyltransferase involved in cell wall biosynthesis
MRDVCLVVPCFNEERRLDRDAFLTFLREHENIAVCFVDDGSSDGTAATVQALQARAPEQILVRILDANRGKAEAVRHGVLYAASLNRFALIGYWDADLSTPLGELPAMIRVFDLNPSCVLAMGSRVRRLGANIRRSAMRRYMGRAFSTLASVLLELPVYDSQCGAKVIRADVAGALFGDPFQSRWIFDVEILARLRNHVGREAAPGALTEVPLTEWSEVGGSKLRSAHMLRAPLELLRISARYNRGPAIERARDTRASTRGVK